MNYAWIFTKIIIIYIVLIILLRILGKREVGQLSIFDLVVLLIIADIASLGIDNDEFFITSLFCLLLLAILQKALSFILLNFAPLRRVVDGNPTIIVYDGNLNIKNMKGELYTIDDLVSQMRSEHVMDISEIRLAILETNGALSIFKKEDKISLAMPVILSGEYVIEHLDCINVSKDRIDLILASFKLELKRIIYASMYEGYLTYYYKNNNKEEVIKGNIIRIL